MRLRSLSIRNFRNLDGSFDLSERVSVVIGPNGIGKTNFLEAVDFLSKGKSFRTNHEVLSVNRTENTNSIDSFARLEGNLEDSLGNRQLLSVTLEQVHTSSPYSCKKTLTINKNKTTRQKFTSIFHSVLFSPNTIDLVAGSPSVRRGDLDDFLMGYHDEYAQIYPEYRKVVRNRNKIFEKLQRGEGFGNELDFWNKQLVAFGSQIIFIRLQVLHDINPYIQQLSSKLFNGQKSVLSIDYKSKFIESPNLPGIRESFAKKVHFNSKKEMFAGMTLYGPHREDFEFLLDNAELREFGSRGQQRLSAFLFKMAQFDLLRQKMASPPILLLDDLFSELDPAVCARLQDYIVGLDAQTVLTALAPDDFTNGFLEKSRRIPIQ